MHTTYKQCPQCRSFKLNTTTQHCENPDCGSSEVADSNALTIEQRFDYSRVEEIFAGIEREIRGRSEFSGAKVWLDKRTDDGVCMIVWKRGMSCTEEEIKHLF
jgi:hypothetical protein